MSDDRPTYANGVIDAGSPATYAIRETIERIMDAGGHASLPYISGISSRHHTDDLIGSIAQECRASYARCSCGRAVWRCGICRDRQPVIDHPECRECAACLARSEADIEDAAEAAEAAENARIDAEVAVKMDAIALAEEETTK